MLVDINTRKTSISHQPDYSVSSLNLSDLQVGKSLIKFSIVWVKFNFNSARWQRRLHVSASRSCQGQKDKQYYIEEKLQKQSVLTCRPQSLSTFCLQKRNRNGLWRNLRIINQGRKFLSGIWSFHVVHLSSIPCFKKYKYLKRVTNVERIPLNLKFWWT